MDLGLIVALLFGAFVAVTVVAAVITDLNQRRRLTRSEARLSSLIETSRSPQRRPPVAATRRLPRPPKSKPAARPPRSEPNGHPTVRRVRVNTFGELEELEWVEGGRDTAQAANPQAQPWKIDEFGELL